MSIIFENTGSIDPRAMTTMGINVKDESRSAIGYFGTGLKYAIAVLLRLGQGVVIHTGGRVYTFTLKEIEVRGKTFQLVCMNGSELGFTTEYGKNWELWMAYRELWSNAMDEGGRVYSSEELPDLENTTQIVIDGIEFDEVHSSREQFLLCDRTPRLKSDSVEVYYGGSDFVFYKGIRAGAVPAGRKSRFTYNIISDMTLTEDRTLAYSWEVQSAITRTILTSTESEFLIAALTETDEHTTEANLDYDQTYTTASDEFISVVGRLTKTQAGKLNTSAVSKYSKQTRSELAPEGRSQTPEEALTIERARAFAEKLGFSNSAYEIRIADSLGDSTLALAVMNESVIVLSTKLVADGWEHTAQAIIEESIHLRHGFGDCSRNMQTFLFEQIVRLGKEFVTEGV